MIPKINFIYSSIYDALIRKLKRIYFRTPRKVLNYIKKVEGLWRKDEEKILKEISKITKLKWQEKQINCYVIRNGKAFSSPLTLPMGYPPDFLIDVLTHELIHRIFAPKENFQKTKKAWNYIHRKYKGESRKTRIHIVIQAIHAYIYLKFYNQKRLERDIEWAKNKKDYRRAWNIIQKEGYQKIIDEFVKRISKFKLK